MLHSWSGGWLGQPAATPASRGVSTAQDDKVSPISSASFKTAWEGGASEGPDGRAGQQSNEPVHTSPPRIRLVDPSGHAQSPSIPSTALDVAAHQPEPIHSQQGRPEQFKVIFHSSNKRLCKLRHIKQIHGLILPGLRHLRPRDPHKSDGSTHPSCWMTNAFGPTKPSRDRPPSMPHSPPVDLYRNDPLPHATMNRPQHRGDGRGDGMLDESYSPGYGDYYGEDDYAHLDDFDLQPDRSRPLRSPSTSHRSSSADWPPDRPETIELEGVLLVPPRNFTSIREIAKLRPDRWISVNAFLTTSALTLVPFATATSHAPGAPPYTLCLDELLDVPVSPELPNRPRLFPFAVERKSGRPKVFAVQTAREWLTWTATIRDLIDLAHGRAPRDLDNLSCPSPAPSSSSSITLVDPPRNAADCESASGRRRPPRRSRNRLDELRQIVEAFDTSLTGIEYRASLEKEFRNRDGPRRKRRDEGSPKYSIEVRPVVIEEIPYENGFDEWKPTARSRPELEDGKRGQTRRLGNDSLVDALDPDELDGLEQIYASLAQRNNDLDSRMAEREREVQDTGRRLRKVRDSLEARLGRGDQVPNGNELIDQLEYLEMLNESRLKEQHRAAQVDGPELVMSPPRPGVDLDRIMRNELDGILYPAEYQLPHIDRRNAGGGEAGGPRRTFATESSRPPFPPATLTDSFMLYPPIGELEDRRIAPEQAVGAEGPVLQGQMLPSRFSPNTSEEVSPRHRKPTPPRKQDDTHAANGRERHLIDHKELESPSDAAFLREVPELRRVRQYRGPPLDELLNLYGEQQEQLRRNGEFNRDLSSAFHAFAKASAFTVADQEIVHRQLKTLQKGQHALDLKNSAFEQSILELAKAVDQKKRRKLPRDVEPPTHQATVARDGPKRTARADAAYRPSLTDYHVVPSDGRMAPRAVPQERRNVWGDGKWFAQPGGGKKLGGIRIWGGPDPVPRVHHDPRWKEGLEAARRGHELLRGAAPSATKPIGSMPTPGLSHAPASGQGTGKINAKDWVDEHEVAKELSRLGKGKTGDPASTALAVFDALSAVKDAKGRL
ncbi:hypothetical protein JCM10212_006332 [Sporobolomyces blumeae]